MVGKEKNMTALNGMKEICAYVNRTEATVIKYIHELNLPAAKPAGAGWISDTDMIDDWRKCIIAGVPYKIPTPKRRR